MTDHTEALLTGFALGLLEGQELAQAQELVRTNPEAAAELARMQDDFHMLAFDAAPLPAPPGGLERLLEATKGVSRFDDFVQTVADLIGDVAARAKTLLDSLDDPASWVPGPAPGTALVHFEGGPRLEAALVGFVSVEPGTLFPEHTHLGEEIVMVLQGAFRDSDGTVVGPGDVRRMSDGTRHDFVALEGPTLIYLVVLERGVEFDFPFEI